MGGTNMRPKLILGFLAVVFVCVVVNIGAYIFIKDPLMGIYLSTIAALTIGLVLGIVISSNITKGIKELAIGAKAISEGDISKKVKVSSKDEIMELATTFNQMQNNLKEIVENVVNISGNVSESAQTLSASAEGMTASAQEIAAANEHIAKGAEYQAESVAKSSQRIREMAVSIEKVATKAQEVSKSATEAGYTAQAAGESSTSAIAKMKSIFEKLETSTTLVHGFGEQTQQITKIVEVIRGIAQQTNLLALNATIEAARAGEYGKGFAVVAEEVRKLAEGTKNSAEQITHIVEEVQTKSSNVLVSMEEGANDIKEGREILNTTSKSLENIINVTIDTGRKVQEISNLSGEQTAGAEEMVREIDNIAKIAEDNAAATEEASAATEELTSSMEELAISAQQLDQISEQLKKSVTKFKVTTDD